MKNPYKNAQLPLNTCPGKTKEGYSMAYSTQLVAGKQIDDSLKQKYIDNRDFRLPRHAPNFQKPKVYSDEVTK